MIKLVRRTSLTGGPRQMLVLGLSSGDVTTLMGGGAVLLDGGALGIPCDVMMMAADTDDDVIDRFVDGKLISAVVAAALRAASTGADDVPGHPVEYRLFEVVPDGE